MVYALCFCPKKRCFATESIEIAGIIKANKMLSLLSNLKDFRPLKQFDKIFCAFEILTFRNLGIALYKEPEHA